MNLKDGTYFVIFDDGDEDDFHIWELRRELSSDTTVEAMSRDGKWVPGKVRGSHAVNSLLDQIR